MRILIAAAAGVLVGGAAVAYKIASIGDDMIKDLARRR